MAVKKAAVAKRPDFTGVPGALVALEGLGGLVFGKHLRTSPYDPLLDQLLAAGSGKALKFGDVKAKASLLLRAKKKGLRVSFAEDGAGALYVRIDGSATEDLRGVRREQIQSALKLGPLSAIKLAVKLRESGDTSVDGQMVEAILGQMQREGVVIKRESGDWIASPKPAK
jgi:hypothetical protein